jgi:hypothetical protein
MSIEDLKVSPELILAVLIIVGAVALKALGKIDDALFYTLILAAIGLITGSYARLNRLKAKNPALKL